MLSISKFNKRIRFLLCVIYIFYKYEWVVPLKDKKGTTITNAFKKHLDESNRKLKKIWVEKGSKFYKRSMKSYLQNNNFQMFSSHDEGKCVVAAKFIRTFKNKIDKYMTYSVSKNMYIDKLFDRVNKYKNT